MCHARRGGPRTLSKTTDANLDREFVEKVLDFVPIIGRLIPLLQPLWLCWTMNFKPKN